MSLPAYYATQLVQIQFCEEDFPDNNFVSFQQVSVFANVCGEIETKLSLIILRKQRDWG